MECLRINEIDFGAGFWTKERKLAGKEVDKFRDQNIPHNSRTIDRTVSLDCIVSHKSTDTRCKSYQSANALYNLGMRFVQQLVDYKGEIRRNNKIGATYHLTWAVEHPNCKRILEWFIPSTIDNIQLEKVILQVVRDSQVIGVEVIVYKVLDY